MKDRFFDEPSLGIAIKLIGKIADELSYTYNSDRRNCLSIVKYFQPVLPQHNTQAGRLKRSSDVLNIFNWLKEQRTSQSDRNSNQLLQKITIELNSEIATVSQVLWWVEQFWIIYQFPKQFCIFPDLLWSKGLFLLFTITKICHQTLRSIFRLPYLMNVLKSKFGTGESLLTSRRS